MLIQLESEPIEMDGVEITARREDQYLKSVGFFEREKRGLGYYIRREEIEKQSYNHVADILRSLPGITVQSRGMEQIVIFNRYMRHDLRPIIVVDGNVLDEYNLGYLDSLEPHHIAALEIYKSDLDAPKQYTGAYRAGGMIIIWTRR